jgi:hypothetical protein
MSAIEEYLVGRLMGSNPTIAHAIFSQQTYDRDLANSLDLGGVLSKAIGSDPTGFINQMGPQQQSSAPTLNQNLGPYSKEISAAAQATGLDPQEIFKIASVESGMKPDAQSPTGPEGIMQLSAAAAKDVGLDPNDRFDPAKNIMAGAQYYKRLKDEFGKDAHLAYHDGPTAVREGNITDEGLKYASLFNEPILSNALAQGSVNPHVAQGESKFLPNPVYGGEGLLATDMDPIRRQYYHFIQQLANSGNPVAISMANELFKGIQESALKAIDPTATQKDMALTNLVPGSKAYSDAVLQTMLKPSTQINMNSGRVAAEPMSDDDMVKWGLPTTPGHPKYFIDQNGKPVAVETKSGTEQEQKSSLYGTNAGAAHQAISKLQNNVDLTKIGIKHLIEDLPWAGDFIAGQYLNPELTSDEQTYNQAVDSFVANVNRQESGAAVTQQEWQMARRRFIPQKGDKPEVLQAKMQNREDAVRLILEGGGALGQEQLKKFQDRVDSASKPAKDSAPALPKLPDGWRWED